MDNFFFFLRKKEVEYLGNRLSVFEYIVSCCYDEEEASNNQIYWEKKFINDINLGIEDDNEYYFYPKGTEDYGIDILEKYDEYYDGKYFTTKVLNGKVELDIITNQELMDIIQHKSKPLDVYKKVTEVVKGQNDHVKSILASIEWNQKLYASSLSLSEISKAKHNLLIMGPTGVGKTDIIRQISEK